MLKIEKRIFPGPPTLEQWQRANAYTCKKRIYREPKKKATKMNAHQVIKAAEKKWDFSIIVAIGRPSPRISHARMVVAVALDTLGYGQLEIAKLCASTDRTVRRWLDTATTSVFKDAKNLLKNLQQG